ncbi:MAG: hypothetical protein KA957_11115, partial [Syntrophaceae bacterium]|nr:hypothetical protein [Syntrophaceae bacterium]
KANSAMFIVKPPQFIPKNCIFYWIIESCLAKNSVYKLHNAKSGNFPWFDAYFISRGSAGV